MTVLKLLQKLALEKQSKDNFQLNVYLGKSEIPLNVSSLDVIMQWLQMHNV